MLINALLKRWSYRIFAPGTLLREQYEAMKQLLQHDIYCHEQMAELQDLLHTTPPEDFTRIRKRFARFSEHVAGMIDALELMAPGKYSSLKSYHRKFDFYTRFILAPPRIDTSPPHVFMLGDLPVAGSDFGNKTRNLITLASQLGLPVPRGFAVSAGGCHRLIAHNALRVPIDNQLAKLDIHNPASLNNVSETLIELIQKASVPDELSSEILTAYDKLKTEDTEMTVAVRSSGLCEDSDTSFAGQFTTCLDVCRDTLLDAYKKVLASQYSPEALYYRVHQGLGDEETAMSVLVVEMVPARCSGVVYTADIHETHRRDSDLHLHVVKGIGEQLVGGRATPEHILLPRQALRDEEPLTCLSTMLSERECRDLGRMAITIEDHFGSPQDIEWAIDNSGRLFFLQARKMQLSAETASPDAGAEAPGDAQILVDGCERASRGVAAGPVYLLDEGHGLADIPPGSVLITENTPPAYVQVIHRLSGVLSSKGSKASHFATVAREFGVPFLCNISNVREFFSQGSEVTVDADNGRVYAGTVDELLPRKEIRPATGTKYHRIIEEALKFITPLELVDPEGANFSPEGCRSMHDIIRFAHEKALQSLFTIGKPGTGLGAVRLIADIPLDVYLFDVGGGITANKHKQQNVPLSSITSIPFQALWRGLSHPDVEWKQKPFDWDTYDRIELAGGVPPKKESFAFASYAVVGSDYLHFNIRFGYHFTIIDVLCGEKRTENHCMLRFAGGGGDYDHRSLRIDFLGKVLKQLGLDVEKKGDLLEAKVLGMPTSELKDTLDMVGRLLGATKLMDMVLEDEQMVLDCVNDFFKGRYSFSQEG